ncbi:MAG: competence/damage-inducible protein A [Ignavibacteriaceae bacterium]
MDAHIITIGDEILTGQTLNTNAGFIGEKLADIQVNIKKATIVGDNEEEILNEFSAVWKNNDLVLVTGGLGPTHDDITRQCVVKFFNTELVKNEEVLDDIKVLFQKSGREVTKINENQSLIPKEAKVIRNTLGTAPGMWIEKNDKIFIALPGVPFEMITMMKNFVIPHLEEKLQENTVVKRSILQTTGIFESTLFEKLGDINELLNGSKLAFLPTPQGVRLRITVEEPTEESAKNKLSEIEQKIKSKAGRFIFATNDIALEEVVGRLLKERGLKISLAESCTGGYVSHLLTNISGSSNYFERGIVSYSNAAKVEILRVNEDALAEYGAVSLEVARQMAEGVKATSGADIGLSITGILGPTGATPGKPIGLVYIGLCDEKVCTAKKFTFGEDRLVNKQRAAQAALEMVRRSLLGIPYDD